MITLNFRAGNVGEIQRKVAKAGWNCTVFPGVNELDPDAQRQNPASAAVKHIGRELLATEIMCFMSHIRALKLFVESGAEHAIILEDDVALAAGFSESIACAISKISQLDAQFYNLHLSSSDARYCTAVSADQDFLVYCAHRFPITASAILWTRKGAKAILASHSKIDMPYDIFLRRILARHNASFSMIPPPAVALDLGSTIDGNNIPLRRYFKRSKWYFWIKQKRILTEKFCSLIDMAIYRWARLKSASPPYGSARSRFARRLSNRL